MLPCPWATTRQTQWSTHQQAAGTINVEVNPGPQNVPIETVFAKIYEFTSYQPSG